VEGQKSNKTKITKGNEIMKNRNTILITVLLVLGLFAVRPAPKAFGVSPTPDGGYPNFTTAEGTKALFSLTTGAANTAVGWFSLFSDTAGSFNTATGAGALLFNTADNNTAFGAAALLFNTTGSENTAVGVSALQSNTTGHDNTANGLNALFSNTTGFDNTAIGTTALFSNTDGHDNTATGLAALALNATGSGNTANGVSALLNNMTGNGNTAIGRNALSNTTGSGNTAVGFNAGSALTTGDNNINIGTDVIGMAGDADTIRIGNPNVIRTFIRGISGNIAFGGATVYVESDGHLGTLTSSARFKDEIKPMDKASDTLFSLKPVTFRYKKEIDPQRIAQFGLVAEEVEKVNPDLVVRDEQGKPYSVRYDQVNAMLLNEFLKEYKAFAEEHRVVQEQGATITRLQKQIEALAAGLQKVRAQVKVTKASPRLVSNSR
jgi:hypothetical protein